jgi:transketolase
MHAEVLCIATGATVGEAVGAVQQLSDQGIRMEVWNAHSLKPFASAQLVSLAKGKRLVVSVEDHVLIGGLASCVAEALAHAGHQPVHLALGVQDRFGESGDPAELYEAFGISSNAIARAVIQASRMNER